MIVYQADMNATLVTAPTTGNCASLTSLTPNGTISGTKCYGTGQTFGICEYVGASTLTGDCQFPFK